MSKHLIISKEELLWVMLTENYGEIAYRMLNDIGRTKRISYKKVSYYLNHMIHNWPDEAVLRTVKTWMIKLNGKFDAKKFLIIFTKNFIIGIVKKL